MRWSYGEGKCSRKSTPFSHNTGTKIFITKKIEIDEYDKKFENFAWFLSYYLWSLFRKKISSDPSAKDFKNNRCPRKPKILSGVSCKFGDYRMKSQKKSDFIIFCPMWRKIFHASRFFFWFFDWNGKQIQCSTLLPTFFPFGHIKVPRFVAPLTVRHVMFVAIHGACFDLRLFKTSFIGTRRSVPCWKDALCHYLGASSPDDKNWFEHRRIPAAARNHRPANKWRCIRTAAQMVGRGTQLSFALPSSIPN